MKTYTFILIGILFFTQVQAQPTPLKAFALSSVSLQDGPFLRAQQADLKYMLELDPDRLLAPFLIEAGLNSKAEPYGNWENTGLNGHIGGHYLSALSLMIAATGNDELKRRLDYMIGKLAECQAKNGTGYVGGVPGSAVLWDEIAKGNIDAQNFSLNKKWVPLYNIHKTFAGLRDAYWVTGNKQALSVLVKLSDWFMNVMSALTDEQIQNMLVSEHGGLNEIFADMSTITGNPKYLVMAKKLSHRSILDPLLAGKDELTGKHANMQIPKVVGYERIAEISGDPDWSRAAGFFWQTVVANRSTSFGGNSVREHFNPSDDFSSMIESNQGPETCNTYNMLRLTKLLFLSHPESKYIDYYERALYNNILSSEHPDGGFVYFTPIRPRHYRVYSEPQNSFWCCVGSGMENHGKYGELIYAHNERDLFVNLFIPSALNWSEEGIKLQQTTTFPYEEKASFTLTLKNARQFALNIRNPGWVNQREIRIAINGIDQKLPEGRVPYFALARKWKTGDVVTVKLPMHTTMEYLPDHSPWASFLRGPIVLAAATEATDMTGLRAEDSRWAHAPEGKFYPIEEAPLIVKRQGDIVDQVVPVKNHLEFTLGDLIYPEKYKDLKLVPFFELHDTRYMLYWRITNPDDLEKIKLEMREREREQLAIAARTVDYVAAGEQQPEVEHRFNGEKTEMGSTNGQPWRSTNGWFSYELINPGGAGKILHFTFAGNGRDRKFEILLNDRLLKQLDLTGVQQNLPYEVEYEIPAEIIKASPSQILVVKFVASSGTSTGRVLGVRLLRN